MGLGGTKPLQAIALLWIALAAFVPLSAKAETGGNGLKVGDGRLHAYFDLESRLDTAAVFQQNLAGAVELKPEILTHIRPGIRFDLPGSAMTLNLFGTLDYVWYMGLLTAGSSLASHLEAGAGLDAVFNKEGVVEFQLGDSFARSDQTSNTALGIGVISLFNEARAALPIHPGGGALEFTPEFAWAVEFFEPLATIVDPSCTIGTVCQPTTVSEMNYSNLHFGLESRWRFLPKTAVVLDLSFDTRSYAQAAANPSPYLFQASAGLAGLLTQKLALIAKAGYGHDFTDTAARTVIGQVELNYLISDTSNVKLGYLRSLTPVPTYVINADDRAYLETKFFLGGRLTLHGNASVDYLSFYRPANSALNNRNDLHISIDLGPEYQFKPWLLGALGYVLTSHNSSIGAQTVNYTRHEAYLRLTLTY